ncbi:MAG: glutathione S-transferase family protein [Oceanospirillaceae bacterium]
MLKLFGHPESGHCYKVKLCLSIGEIEHDYQVIDISLPRDQRPQDFQDKSKFQEVPLLIHNQTPYVQSNAILLHIAEHFSVFGGNTPHQLQKCRQWLFWESNKIGLCLPQLRFAAKFAPEQFNQGTLDWLTSRYNQDINVIEQELSDGRNFMLGDQLTIADFSLCGYLYFAEQAQVDVPPFTGQWLDRISKLNGWKHPYQLLSA